jgi:hypothetical protein
VRKLYHPTNISYEFGITPVFWDNEELESNLEKLSTDFNDELGGLNNRYTGSKDYARRLVESLSESQGELYKKKLIRETEGTARNLERVLNRLDDLGFFSQNLILALSLKRKA